MVYAKAHDPWVDGEDGGTRIDAADLNQIEQGVADAHDAIAALEPSSYTAINEQTGTAYTLQASDVGKLVTIANSAPVTVTVPASTLTSGERIDVAVLDAGQATFVGAGGMVLTGTPSLVTRDTGSAVTVVALSATEALVVGDLA